MRFLISSLLAFTMLSSHANALDIQAAIDALGTQGGVVNIPCGQHPNGNLPLRLRTGVILRGEGRGCTIIPPIANSPIRIYNVGLADVTVSIALGTTSGYGIDWRNVTLGHIEDVHVSGFAYGLIMTGPTYYNNIEDLSVAATNTAVEISNGANQNIFNGGKFSAPIGLAIYNSNGMSFTGTSLEDGINNMTFKIISGDDGSTTARGVRQEDANHSSVWWNQP